MNDPAAPCSGISATLQQVTGNALAYAGSIFAVARSFLDGETVDGMISEYYNIHNHLNTS